MPSQLEHLGKAGKAKSFNVCHQSPLDNIDDRSYIAEVFCTSELVPLSDPSCEVVFYAVSNRAFSQCSAAVAVRLNREGLPA